jgi:hypothetical protein
VTGVIGGRTVRLSEGVDCKKRDISLEHAATCLGNRDLTMRTSRCAAVGVITELMDVHAPLGIGVVASDVPCDGGRGRLSRLLEGNGASDLRITSNECNYGGPMPSVETLAWLSIQVLFASRGNLLSTPPLARKLGTAGSRGTREWDGGIRRTCFDHFGF